MDYRDAFPQAEIRRRDKRFVLIDLLLHLELAGRSNAGVFSVRHLLQALSRNELGMLRARLSHLVPESSHALKTLDELLAASF